MASITGTLRLGTSTIAYLKSGEAGSPVVLVHGFGSDRTSWALNQAELARRHTVYALDLPGHGQSAPDIEAGDLETLSGIVSGFLQALDLSEAHLIGHSLGGALCLLAAQNIPERVRKLTLIAPFGIGATFDRTFAEDFLAMQSEEEALAVLRRLVARPQLVGPRMAAAVLAQLQKPGMRDALARLAKMSVLGAPGAGQHLAALLKDLQPKLIWGEEDRILTPDFHSEPFSSAYRVSGTGHLPQMELAAHVNELLLAE